MSTHKHIDWICVIAVVLAVCLMLLFLHGDALGIQSAETVMGYETRLFDTTRVHTIDIVMDDWDSFIETCTNEEYAVCSVVIDGEAYKNVGIRAKGNTSLSTVASMNSDRYSFKIEFDQYDSTINYHGLDKLSLNNLILDTTYMKDYLAYQLMASYGVDTPLCSYVYITVNGEDWGLYLAVEGVEEAFLQRNYGSDYGELYKPDSGEIGGGRGNGQDFNFEEFMNSEGTDMTMPTGEMTGDAASSEGMDTSSSSGETTSDETIDPSSSAGGTDATAETVDPSSSAGGTETTEGLDASSSAGGMETGQNNRPNTGMNGMFDMMSASDVKLQYIDDDPDSYANIFNNAKTDITEADKNRLVESLKTLSTGENIEAVVDVEKALRYFVVQNFLVNGDGYTGSMVHNYYLYEENGLMTMIPWDYNLAYGSFHTLDTNSSVNDPIDTPLSVTGSGDRPMADWIFTDEAYLELYHLYFAEFLDSHDFQTMLEETLALIQPYVEKDPTRFYTYQEFETGVETLRTFLNLRVQSVQGQLDGTIPSTSEGQAENGAALIDASSITLSDMGSMNMGNLFGGQGGMERNPNQQMPNGENADMQSSFGQNQNGMPSEKAGDQPDGTVPQQSSGDDMMTQFPQGNQQRPNDFSGQVPEGMGDRFAGFNGDNRMDLSDQMELFLSIGLSMLVLLAGIVLVLRYKRRG